MSTFKIRQILMVKNNLWLIIARDTSWTQHCGIAQAGQLRKMFTLIKLEPNTENNSINQNHSIRERSEKQVEDWEKNSWHTNQEIWNKQDLVEISSTSEDSKKMGNQSISTRNDHYLTILDHRIRNHATKVFPFKHESAKNYFLDVNKIL